MSKVQLEKVSKKPAEENKTLDNVSPKKGGPYTKKDQSDRRNKVYKLHFENGYPAIKIAEKLNVNRNTINDDIKFWYFQISTDSEFENPRSTLTKHIRYLESQKCRLYEELEGVENIHEKLSIKKLI